MKLNLLFVEDDGSWWSCLTTASCGTQEPDAGRGQDVRDVGRAGAAHARIGDAEEEKTAGFMVMEAPTVHTVTSPIKNGDFTFLGTSTSV